MHPINPIFQKSDNVRCYTGILSSVGMAVCLWTSSPQIEVSARTLLVSSGKGHWKGVLWWVSRRVKP
eukprot:1160381-Pelagomonas_calceolata.AAC.1